MATIDFLILILYTALIFGVGLYGKKISNLSTYLTLDGKMHWMWITLSIVATETSSLTFISIPGLALISGFSFLHVGLGYMAGRLAIALFILPGYFRGKWISIYQVLQEKHSRPVQVFASLLFHVTRILADSVRLYATALPLHFIFGWNIWISLLLIAGLTIIYTVQGGLRTVIRTDSLQFLVYILAGMALLIYAYSIIIDQNHLSTALQLQKQKFLELLLFPQEKLFQNYNLLSGLLGGALLSIASHGTDHIFVQRLLAAGTLQNARRALVTSGILVLFQFAFFLSLGLWLQSAFPEIRFDRPDDFLPKVVADHTPWYIRDFVLIGILSAAMSSLSSSVNALAASSAVDLLRIHEKNLSDTNQLMTIKRISLFWSFLLVISAILLGSVGGILVEIGLSVASITYAPILGIFLISNRQLSINFYTYPILWASALSLLANIYLVFFSNIFWLWYLPAGLTVFLFGLLLFLSGQKFTIFLKRIS